MTKGLNLRAASGTKHLGKPSLNIQAKPETHLIAEQTDFGAGIHLRPSVGYPICRHQSHSVPRL